VDTVQLIPAVTVSLMMAEEEGEGANLDGEQRSTGPVDANPMATAA
jgi:hypothetical protein